MGRNPNLEQLPNRKRHRSVDADAWCKRALTFGLANDTCERTFTITNEYVRFQSTPDAEGT